MVDAIVEFLKTPVRPGMVVAIQVVIWAPLGCLVVYKVQALSTAGLRKLIKFVLIILFLPFVLVWKVATAGSDCSCLLRRGRLTCVDRFRKE